ncbi:diol dehydratase small subunit [Taklimakanibacter lacteus]|uniref:diol dehydratase small subunit n=1 Tax=Taklimakanibacter lacteus TaxID=2268456 RepID=UPI000E666B0C
MNETRKTIYPLSERDPDNVRTATGLSLTDMTLDAVIKGKVTASDVAITPETLRLQAEVARSAGRDRLALNLERAAELARVPQEVLMSTYELLRPGRTESSHALRERARALREQFGAIQIAGFLEEAADAYDARGLFSRRY